MNKVEKAKRFAADAHNGRPKKGVAVDSMGRQVRKFSGIPYIVHPMAVAALLEQYVGDEDAICCALLHDVVEDTEVTMEEVDEIFGPRVAKMVLHVTEISKKSDGNRAARKAIDAEHYARGCYFSQSVKVCDLIDNTSDITAYDVSFAETYLKEKEKLLDMLTKADGRLLLLARQVLAAAQSNIMRATLK